MNVILQALRVNGNTYTVPNTLAALADAINEQAELVAQAEGTAFEHSVIEGQFLIEARRRVKAEKKKGDKGWMKWLEDNYLGGLTSAYRSISIAEYFPMVEGASSRMEALRIIDELKKRALVSGDNNGPGRPRKQLPATGETAAIDLVINPRSKLKQQCERCDFIPEHMVQLEIHHKDGNHYNNAEENLQTLCANCHVLLKLGPWWLKKAF